MLFASIDVKMPPKMAEAGTGPKHLREMGIIAATAIKLIRQRFIKTQTDGRGRKAKPLRKRRGFMAMANDARFQGVTKAVKSSKKIRVAKDYPSVKRALGAKPVRDGKLTGDMWNGLTPTVKRIPGGWVLVLRFTGGTRTGMIQIGTKMAGRKGKKRRVPRMKTVTVYNRDKAKQWQTHSKGRISLLSMTRKDRRDVMNMYVKLIEVFGQRIKI